jgi:hypothetical protein
MTNPDLHPIYQQLGEVLSGLKSLAEAIELRQSQTEKLYDVLRADVANLRQDQRDIDEKLDCVICVMQHDLEHLRADAVHSTASIGDLLTAIQTLSRPVSDIVALRSRAAGVLVGLGVLGSVLLWLAEPVYRWFVVDRILSR